jgi:outer membrane protein OmpA-like peptidoglycan-associated protein
MLVVFSWLSTDIKAVTTPQEAKAAELKAQAKKYDKNSDVYNAISYYTQYLTIMPKDVKINWRLARLLFQTRDYAEACRYFDTVIVLKPKKFPMAYYYKGVVCMNLQKYDAAIEAFTIFRKVYRKLGTKPDYRKLAGIYAESAAWAKSHLTDNGDVVINHPGMSLNHSNIDFAPFPVDENTLLYGAVYSDSSQDLSPVRQIYKAERINGQWKNLGRIDSTINNPEFNTGNAIVSPDGQRMYFTRSRINWQKVEISEIYESQMENGSWSEPRRLPYPVNDENYTSTQPALGRDAKTGNDVLYFVSNRKGCKGGLDIWYSIFDKKTGKYAVPQALDKSVNSIGDECCPFYDLSSRTLYFSSNGRSNGLGGFDIYQANGSIKKWTGAQPLPVPYNSSYDEYYFSILKNNKEGYFSSNRPGAFASNGSCCDDIFYFKINNCVRVNSTGIIRNSSNAEFYNSLNTKYHLGIEVPKDSLPLANVPVELYLTDDAGNNDIFISKTYTDACGQYSFELERNKHYKILAKNYGYHEKSANVSTLYANCSDTIKIENTFISYVPKVNARINIYYDYNDDHLSDSARRSIDMMLVPLFELFPNAIIEIGSHTDNNGSSKYNLDLSQRRSESVVNYLVTKGISKDRLVARGYGMDKPIAPNTNADGSDNPAGRQLNRRTEMSIVGEISSILNE